MDGLVDGFNISKNHRPLVLPNTVRRAARRLYDWRLHYILYFVILRIPYRIIEFLSFVDEPLIII